MVEMALKHQIGSLICGLDVDSLLFWEASTDQYGGSIVMDEAQELCW